jgi:hypothetical protein
MKYCSILYLLMLAILFSCGSNKEEQKQNNEGNPAAEGFDLINSDPAAIELADTIMAAMGGRANWDKTRFISWNFGKRDLVWDKHQGRVRIEAPADSIIYLINVNTGEGKVQVKGQTLPQSDSLQKMLQRAKSIWINDSYWLVMPFKLKDSGVTLKYLGEDTLNADAKCNVLELTFKNVGDTPDNKYRLYVDLKDNLIKKWAYYENADQDSASRIWPFDNYKKYGDILLSADRSDGRGPKDVKVSNEMPDKVFEEFTP